MEQQDICGAMAYQPGCEADGYQKASIFPSVLSSGESSVVPVLTPPPTPEGSSPQSKEPTIFKKLHQSLTKINVKSALLHLSTSKSSSPPAILQETERMTTMEDVQLRQKKVGSGDFSTDQVELSDEWKKRLTDYQFLSGNGQQQQPENKRLSLFSRRSFSRRNRRSSIAGSEKRNRNNGQLPVCLSVFFNIYTAIIF